jgi:triacylglycerol lipase
MHALKRLGNLGLLSTLAIGLAYCMPAQASSTYAKTKYPVVLAHGMFGWDVMLGIDYWYQIPADLKNNGATVYTTQVSNLESSEVRGEQLLQQVKQIMAITGKSKVNLIGHSHGGHSVRYVAAAIPNQVASVTGMASPVKGAPLADLIVNGGTAGTVGTQVLQGLGVILSVLSGGGNLNVSANQSLVSLSTAGSAAFNAKYPQAVPTTACGEGAYTVNGVRYYSFGGVSPVTNIFDILDSAVGLVSLASNKPNDGLVEKCSTHLGQVIRDDYQMNHIDFMNHVFGIRAIGTDPKEVYRQQLNRLKTAGF